MQVHIPFAHSVVRIQLAKSGDCRPSSESNIRNGGRFNVAQISWLMSNLTIGNGDQICMRPVLMRLNSAPHNITGLVEADRIAPRNNLSDEISSQRHRQAIICETVNAGTRDQIAQRQK